MSLACEREHVRPSRHERAVGVHVQHECPCGDLMIRRDDDQLLNHGGRLSVPHGGRIGERGDERGVRGEQPADRRRDHVSRGDRECGGRDRHSNQWRGTVAAVVAIVDGYRYFRGRSGLGRTR